MNIREMELLAGIIANCLSFLKSGCKIAAKYYCRSRGEEVSARQMFCQGGPFFFVHPDSLPLDPNIKTIGVNIRQFGGEGRLHIETTMIDWVKFESVLQENRLRYSELELRGRRIFWRNNLLLHSRTQQHFRRGITSPRTLLYTDGSFVQADFDGLAAITDLIYNFNCFVELEALKIPGLAVHGFGRIEMRQELSMRQQQLMTALLLQEQKPMMIQVQYMQAKLFNQQRVLKMSADQLNQHIAEVMQNNPVLATS